VLECQIDDPSHRFRRVAVSPRITTEDVSDQRAMRAEADVDYAKKSRIVGSFDNEEQIRTRLLPASHPTTHESVSSLDTRVGSKAHPPNRLDVLCIAVKNQLRIRSTWTAEVKALCS
jgi:hypothetical protein